MEKCPPESRAGIVGKMEDWKDWKKFFPVFSNH